MEPGAADVALVHEYLLFYVLLVSNYWFADLGELNRKADGWE
jgi:hypothetical protein